MKRISTLSLWRLALFALAVCGLPTAALAQDSEPAAQGSAEKEDKLDLRTTVITGNQELPRVLYILPWRHPEMGEGFDRPGKSLLDEVVEPVDRINFRRELRYRDSLAERGGP